MRSLALVASLLNNNTQMTVNRCSPSQTHRTNQHFYLNLLCGFLTINSCSHSKLLISMQTQTWSDGKKQYRLWGSWHKKHVTLCINIINLSHLNWYPSVHMHLYKSHQYQIQSNRKERFWLFMKNVDRNINIVHIIIRYCHLDIIFI